MVLQLDSFLMPEHKQTTMDPMTLFTKQGSVLYTDAACQVSGVNPEIAQG